MFFQRPFRITNFSQIRSASTRAASYPIRSIFFAKKTRAALEKVKSIRPDIVALDLEDSVAEDEKESVRELYLNALRDKLFTGTKVFVRTSPLANIEDLQKDITMFTGSGIEGFILPKVESEADIIEVERVIAAIEKEKNEPMMQTKLLPLIETSPAYFALDKIAFASKRNIALAAGSGDFTADVLCDDHSHTYNAYISKVVLAAKCAGIQSIWGVHDKIDDNIGFDKYCNQMKRSGFAGAWALTPKQVIMANAIFSLSPNESQWIQAVRNNGANIKVIQRSVQESRQMIGPPHRLKAENMAKQYPSIYKGNDERKPTTNSSSNGISPTLKIGEIVPAPHEITVTESLINTWDSSFSKYSSNGLINGNSVTQCAPFSLTVTMAVALTVSSLSYHARVHLGFKDIFQERPLLPGDTVRALFRIEDVKVKKGGDSNLYSVATSKHWVVNQNNRIVLQLDKVTMFQPKFCALKSAATKNMKSLYIGDSSLYESLIKCNEHPFLSLKSSPEISTGDIIVHDSVKVMGCSETRLLCNLLNIINPHHHNIARYSDTDILVPGPFVMSAVLSNATQSIGQIIYEDIPYCVHPNKVNLGDQIGTITFIQSCKVLELNPQFEEVVMKHVAVKNIDMEILSSLNLPLELFTEDQMKPSEYEQLCSSEIPLLIHKIVCIMTRKVIRLRPGLYKHAAIPNELC